MALDPSFDPASRCSLDQAKIIERKRLNSLGSYELTINYNQINARIKEQCLEWLEANQLQIVNPVIGGKTLEETWESVSIAYNQDASIIQQIFKVDSQVGNLGDADEEPDYSLQTGDLARISDGMEIERAYYWRVVSPETVELPSTRIVGQIWTKTANDNGDGTYDVIVSKEVAQNQEAYGAMQFGGANVQSDDIEVVGAGTTGANGTYVLTGTSQGKDYWYNGSFYLNWNTTDGGTWFISDTLPPIVTWYYRVLSTSDVPPTGGWSKSGAADDPPPTLQIGSGSGGPYSEETDIDTNNTEQKFSSDGGAIADAVDGEIKTITNTPLENGNFRSVVTTRSAKSLRIPNSEGSFFAYGSDYLVTGKAMIVGRNRTYDQFTADTQLLRGVPYLYRVNNVSMRVNDFGLHDYTITSNEPG